ncbi:hypothetical protein BV25DRAFT_1919486 [Artomyces pyxidatus]|uniref:Uncharacterized protein n=1 Tax=Artomyces pyxidatus TaxID=48021 RepID=A0ACB8SQT8_9AGAM|nr:hypothetical protein BV25DRAFT_1919486 [Artomyces pyxidatus]
MRFTADISPEEVDKLASSLSAITLSFSPRVPPAESSQATISPPSSVALPPTPSPSPSKSIRSPAVKTKRATARVQSGWASEQASFKSQSAPLPAASSAAVAIRPPAETAIVSRPRHTGGNRNKNVAWAVFRGRSPGVYSSWDEAQWQIGGVQNSSHKAYPDWNEAVEAFADRRQRGLVEAIRPSE